FVYLPVVESRTPLWTTPTPAVVTGLRTDVPEVLVTDAIDATPDHRHVLDGPSVWPLLTALASGIGVIVAIFTPWGVTLGAVLLASVLPMALVDRAVRREARRPAWLALLVVIALGAVSLALRVPEFHALGCRWDSHAYGSVVWTTLGMHTAHVLTSTVENVL